MKTLSIIITTIFTSIGVYAQNVPESTVTSSGSGTVGYPANFSSSTKFNYTRTYIPFEALTSLPAFDATKTTKVQVKTSYVDGWGRPLMDILRNGSGSDIIKPYDNRYRKLTVDFLPYADTFHSKFQNASFSRQRDYYNNNYSSEGNTAYQKANFDENNGVVTQSIYSPGKATVSNDIGLSNSKSLYETVNDTVYILSYSGTTICKNGIYTADQLTVTTSEGVNQTTAISKNYVDKTGNIICKKISSDNGWLSTYYVYDDLNRLTAIIPPKGSVQLSSANCVSHIEKLCFLYSYDKEGNMVKRSVPGKDSADYMIYDQDNRLCMSQSALLRSRGQWLFTIYDKTGRVEMTGIYNSEEDMAYWEGIISGSNPLPLSKYDQNNNPVDIAITLENYFVNGVELNSYPDTIYNCQILTYNYYDNYDFWPANLVTFDNSWQSDYSTSVIADQLKEYLLTHGKLIASRTRVLDNGYSNNFMNQWVTSVYFYDEKGRRIQTQTLNPWNATDWDQSTVQYTFTGKPIRYFQKLYNWQQANYPVMNIITRFAYESNTGRLGGIEQKIDTCAWHPIATYYYDELGRVKTKKLGGMAEVQHYTYNMRGQFEGINAAQLMDTTLVQLAGNDTMSFWEEIGYERGFTQHKYDNRMSGYKWRSKGSKPMAYGYTYDNSGRMVAADFRECSFANGTTGWNKNNKDFSVSDLSFDDNGNITTMKQRGYDMNFQPGDIDDLTYAYDDGNRLLGVTDDTSMHSPIVDFTDGNIGSNDYQYDPNGNLIADANKGISNITYNYLNQPIEITTATGTIQNIYDASGKLIQKSITDNAGTITYRYQDGCVFKGDSLQYVLHSEGRARWLADSGYFKYDYFIRDHLGNVRTIVASDVTFDTIGYHSGFEMIAANQEEVIFGNIGEIRDMSPLGTPSDLMSGWLNGANADEQIGAALLLQGMAGDQFNLKGYGYYEDTSTADFNTHALPEDMLSSLLGVLTNGAVPGGEGGADPVGTINSLLTTENYDIYENLRASATDPNYPQVYLNYLVFTEDMTLDPANSHVVQLRGAANSWQLMELSGVMTMPYNGYLLTYFSNQSNMSAAIDNIYAIHYKGRLLEEQHYYPYGLPIEAGAQPNSPLMQKYLTQGNRMQDELGLNLLDFNARNYDQQIGRFTGVDLLADNQQEYLSPYQFCNNDPANFIDPLGTKEFPFFYTQKTGITPEPDPYAGSARPQVGAIFTGTGGQGTLNVVAIGEVIQGQIASITGINGFTITGIQMGSNGAWVQVGQVVHDDNWFNPEVGINWTKKMSVITDIFIDFNRYSNRSGWKNANLVMGATGASVGLQDQIMSYGVRSSFSNSNSWREFNKLDKGEKTLRELKILGKQGKTVLKTVKIVGNVTAALSTGYTVWDAGSYYYNGGTDWQVGAKAGLDLVMTGVGFLGPLGFAISTTYFIMDASTNSFGGFGEH